VNDGDGDVRTGCAVVVLTVLGFLALALLVVGLVLAGDPGVNR
jgi:hypothetical protein